MKHGIYVDCIRQSRFMLGFSGGLKELNHDILIPSLAYTIHQFLVGRCHGRMKICRNRQ
jgi:hypothetical protein